MAKLKYLTVPICFLEQLFVDKKSCIDRMIQAGIKNYASNIMIDVQKAWSLVLYEWLSERSVPNEAATFFDSVRIEREACFDPATGKFSPENALGQMPECPEVIGFGGFLSAMQATGLVHPQPYVFYQQAQAVQVTSKVFVMINVRTLIKYRDAPQSEFALAQLAVYMALKSIAGKQKAVKTNVAHVLSRAFPDARETADNALTSKYQKRRQWDKLAKAMQLHWGLKIYSRHTRGFYFSTRQDVSLEALAIIAESKKVKNIDAKLKAATDAAQKKAIEFLYKQRTK